MSSNPSLGVNLVLAAMRLSHFDGYACMGRMMQDGGYFGWRAAKWMGRVSANFSGSEFRLPQSLTALRRTVRQH